MKFPQWNPSLDRILSSSSSWMPQWSTTTTTVIAVAATATVIAVTSWRRQKPSCHTKHVQTWDARVVRPHGPWQEIWPQRLYSLEAPGCSMGPPVRNMSVYRIPDDNGKLVLYNGVSLSDAALEELLTWGTPSILIVPNGMHREDAAIWKDKFPAVLVVCPSSQREKVEEVVKVDTTMEEWVSMEEWSKWVRAKEIDGWCKFELVLEVQLEEVPKENGKIAMMVCDLLFTMPYNFNFSWSDKIISWCFDSHIVLPEDPKTTMIVPQVSRIARLFVIRDWKKAEQWYRNYAKECGKRIAVILVGHGIPVVQLDPAEGCTKALEGVADQLIKPRW